MIPYPTFGLLSMENVSKMLVMRSHKDFLKKNFSFTNQYNDIVKPRPKTPNPLGQAPTQSNPKAQSGTRGLRLTLKSYATPPPHPITFRSPVWDNTVQVEAPSTPECQEGIPSQGGHQREEQRVVQRVQEEHNEGHIQ